MGLDTDGLEGSHPLGSLMLLSPGGGGGVLYVQSFGRSPF